MHHETPLRDCPDLARLIGVRKLTIKDERGRMGLGSFKALGAPYAGLRVLQRELSKILAKNLELCESVLYPALVILL